MAFTRREGLAGGGITKYADQKLKCCPFCGTDSPHWLTDAYIANYSLIATNCVNGYKFQCEKCGGVLEIQGKTDFCFQRESFVSVKLVSVGLGTMNAHKIDQPLTLEELKELCQGNKINPTNEPFELEDEEYESVIVEEKQLEVATCPKCGTEVGERQKFCSRCGVDLSAIVEQDKTKVKYCIKCGSPVVEGQKFCSKCGHELAKPIVVHKTETITVTTPAIKPKEYGSMSAFAKIGNIFGIIAISCSLIPLINVLSLILGVPGIIFSALGFKSKLHKGKANAGLILSIVGFVVGIILFVLYLGIMEISCNPYGSYYDYY